MAVAAAGPYANHLHLAPDRQPRQHVTTQFFTGQMSFLPSNQQRQSTEGIHFTSQSDVKAMMKAVQPKLSKNLVTKSQICTWIHQSCGVGKYVMLSKGSSRCVHYIVTSPSLCKKHQMISVLFVKFLLISIV